MKFFALHLFFLISISAFAQETLRMEYVKTSNYDPNYEINIYNADGSKIKNSKHSKDFIALMSRPAYYELFVKGNESIFKNIPRINNEQDDNLSVKIVSSHNEETYFNAETQIKKRNEFEANTEFLVIDTLDVPNWNITREKSKVLNYDVRLATWEKDSIRTYKAWFAPKLSYKLGPKDFWGLPGLILEIVEEVKENNFLNTHTFTAIKIEVAKQDDVQEPTKGKIISEQELNEIYNEQWERSKEMYGGGVDTSD